MNKFIQLLFLLLFMLHSLCISGQELLTNRQETMPLDSSITYGTLENGFRYYIKHVPDSNEKINLRFLVLAGINHQDTDQLNMAHFVEHMAFKSTDHFPKGIRYELETSKSFRMGTYDIGGTAGTHHTTYFFDPPANNEKALDTGLKWFKDIATSLHLKNDEIQSERGVLIQEIIERTPDNMDYYFLQKELMYELNPCSQIYTDYVDHQKTFDPERLRKFYNDWYRPELMALVAVGKIDDVSVLEKEIKNRFSDIRPKLNPREVPDCTALYYNRPSQFVVIEKPEGAEIGTGEVQVELFFRDRKTLEMLPVKEGIQRLNKINLLVQILNKRLREATKIYNRFSIFEVIHSQGSQVVSHPSSFKFLVLTDDDNVREDLQTTSYILNQIKKHGVLEEEFSEVKEVKLKELEMSASYEPKYWLEEIENHIVNKTAIPSDKREFEKKWLLNYEANDLNEFIREINLAVPDDIGILAPKNSTASRYKEVEVQSFFTRVSLDSISPYVKPAAPSSLMTTEEVEELAEMEFNDNGWDKSGAREIVLQNGIKVVFKPINQYQSDQRGVVLHGFCKNGALKFPKGDYFSAINAPLFIYNAGMGKFNKFELQRFRSNISISFFNTYINNEESGIKMAGSPANLKEMLQLVFLSFTQPRKDSLAFEDWKTRQRNYYTGLNDWDFINLNNNIKKIIGDNSGISQGTERFMGLEETDMRKGYEIYKNVFGNPQDFTFLLTGTISVDSVIPMVTKYLGNLPSSVQGSTETSCSNSFYVKPIGPVLMEYTSQSVIKRTKNNFTYLPSFIIEVEDQVDWKENLIARALSGVLDAKIKQLRNRKGYSLYSVGAGFTYNPSSRQYKIQPNISCTPTEYPQLRKEFTRIIDSLKENLVSEEVLQHAIKVIQSAEDPIKRGMSLINISDKLYNQYRYGVPWVDQNQITTFIETISPDEIQTAAQKYFIPENLYEFVMKY